MRTTTALSNMPRLQPWVVQSNELHLNCMAKISLQTAGTPSRSISDLRDHLHDLLPKPSCKIQSRNNLVLVTQNLRLQSLLPQCSPLLAWLGIPSEETWETTAESEFRISTFSGTVRPMLSSIRSVKLPSQLPNSINHQQTVP